MIPSLFIRDLLAKIFGLEATDRESSSQCSTKFPTNENDGRENNRTRAYADDDLIHSKRQRELAMSKSISLEENNVVSMGQALGAMQE